MAIDEEISSAEVLEHLEVMRVEGMVLPEAAPLQTSHSTPLHPD